MSSNEEYSFEESVKQHAKIANKKYGGKLKNWSLHNIYDDVYYIMGVVSGQDPTHRFNEGDTGNYAVTANTVYLLEGPRNPNPIPDGLAKLVFF